MRTGEPIKSGRLHVNGYYDWAMKKHNDHITAAKKEATKQSRTLDQKDYKKWYNSKKGQLYKLFDLYKEITDAKLLVLAKLKSVKRMAKFSGATGNYHTFDIVDSKLNWIKLNKKFINSFGINHNEYTTQIEPHDWIADVNHSVVRINNILIDLCQDLWIYISNDIFALKLLKNEVGSSTMPHKVNPIDFENAEGNFGMSNALNEFFANKLQKSRHQRDLSDSTVLRNIGLGFGYSALALISTSKGLEKITPNKLKISEELDSNWEDLTEAVQTFMRYEGVPDAYEQLKNLSRGSKLNKETYISFIKTLAISEESKNKLLQLKPSAYIGIAEDLSKN